MEPAVHLNPTIGNNITAVFKFTQKKTWGATHAKTVDTKSLFYHVAWKRGYAQFEIKSLEFTIIYVLHSTKFLRRITTVAFVDESWTAKYFYRFTYRINSALIFLVQR